MWNVINVILSILAILIVIFIIVVIIDNCITEKRALKYIKENLGNEFSPIRIKFEVLLNNEKTRAELLKRIDETDIEKFQQSILCYAKIDDNNFITVEYINKNDNKVIKREEYKREYQGGYGQFLYEHEIL